MCVYVRECVCVCKRVCLYVCVRERESVYVIDCIINTTVSLWLSQYSAEVM